jgi:hypothetical protein
MKFEYVKIKANCIPGGNKMMYKSTTGCGSDMQAKIWYNDDGSIDEKNTYTQWYLEEKYGGASSSSEPSQSKKEKKGLSGLGKSLKRERNNDGGDDNYQGRSHHGGGILGNYLHQKFQEKVVSKVEAEKDAVQAKIAAKVTEKIHKPIEQLREKTTAKIQENIASKIAQPIDQFREGIKDKISTQVTELFETKETSDNEKGTSKLGMFSKWFK